MCGKCSLSKLGPCGKQKRCLGRCWGSTLVLPESLRQVMPFCSSKVAELQQAVRRLRNIREAEKE